jgi:hypothetical protein
MNTSNMHNARRPLDANAENDYWRNHYERERYYEAGRGYEEYESAYRTGYEGHDRYPGRTFAEVENQLKADWESAKGRSQLAWDRAKQAARAAWDRVEHAMPGDVDRDGR